MYTLKPSITRLAAEETIIGECGTYVTRRGYVAPSWPSLLRLYTKLVPGMTVHEWVEKNDILALGIDPRRFVSFGIIKGFLRRVHRWPVILERGSPFIEQPEHRRRVEFDTTARGSGTTLGTKPGSGLNRAGESTFTLRSMESNASLGVSPSSMPNRTPPSVTRSPSRRPMGFTSMRETFPRSLGSAADTQPSNSSRRTGPPKPGALKVKEEVYRVLEEDLVRYLDGAHHTDEIQVRFGLSWARLEAILGVEEMKDGRGKKGVTVVYR
jgi:hypothetical protein